MRLVLSHPIPPHCAKTTRNGDPGFANGAKGWGTQRCAGVKESGSFDGALFDRFAQDDKSKRYSGQIGKRYFGDGCGR